MADDTPTQKTPDEAPANLTPDAGLGPRGVPAALERGATLLTRARAQSFQLTGDRVSRLVCVAMDANGIAVSKDKADSRGWQVGDTIPVRNVESGLTISGTIEKDGSIRIGNSEPTCSDGAVQSNPM